MKLQVRALSAALAALVLAGPAAAISPEELYDRVSPSIWLVENDMGGGKGAIGSAVVIAPGVLVTNCHVVEKAASLRVAHEERRFPAQLQYQDPVRDLCQLQASGVDAPAVRIAAASHLRVGAKVYALGNPKGLELTLSDGLVSALRHGRAGELEYVQISVPISPGSSGGGLFDQAGRLVGITTAGMKDGQNLNFALPAEWIVDLPARAGGGPAVARLDAEAPARAAPAPAAVAPPAEPAPPAAVATLPNVFEYRLRDGLTGQARTVVYHVDKRVGDTMVMNGGARVEDASGRVVSLKQAIAGEFEQAMPPGGWVSRENAGLAGWSSKYDALGDSRRFGMELKARAMGDSTMRLNGRELRIVRVAFDGFTTRGGGATNNPPGRYQAVAWFAPELGRVVRFEAKSRGGLGLTAFVVNESLELVDIRTE
ncbi:trypsin-like peptidase domain-containing protein [Ramlibacter sp. G-1-2-2]|uniref:Trypsin-like peptidase domain-containing protein n=1 Tax=Ramlibacter agri TaxID=2728837 RepID=A0A848GZQ5_9BURK|nr:serine protease [Ramlibacter agri]NML42779.1 trypsin-like peptidase domain-containing protein [Ramlibacter agri]